jgi:hypothetical protein
LAITTSTYSTLLGYGAGKGITTSDYNICIGKDAGYGITTGSNNICIGQNTGAAIAGGAGSVIIGDGAGLALSGNSYCTFVGTSAGAACYASYNTCVGRSAGASITSGISNTCVGYAASSSGAGTYNTHIGYGAVSNGNSQTITIGNGAFANADYSIVIGISLTNSTSNRIMIGNSSGYIYNDFTTNNIWTQTSDERLKKDIVDCPLGLEFIDQLRPVKFKWNRPNEQCTIPQYGFTYQQVMSVIDAHCPPGESFKAFAQMDGEYGSVGQTAIIPPMVQAIKELKTHIATLEARLAALEARL